MDDGDNGGDPLLAQQAANFGDAALRERLWMRAATLFCVDDIFAGVDIDPATGDITDSHLYAFLAAKTKLSPDEIHTVIDDAMVMILEMLDDGRTDATDAAQYLRTEGDGEQWD